jgi:hypothetical protein
MPPAGEDEALAFGYVFLLQRLLEHLRYRTDRGYDDAFVGGVPHQSKIPASPELAAASARYSAGRLLRETQVFAGLRSPITSSALSTPRAAKPRAG